MRTPDDLPLIDVAFLHRRCSAVDGCLLWKGQLRHGPCVTIARKQYQVRHLVWNALGHRLDRSCTVVARCGEARCVSPDCLKKEVRNAHARGKKMPLLQRKRIADAKRAAMGTITMEIAREIRASTEAMVVLAARYHMPLSSVHRVRQGTAWIDYQSPFAQLALRA